MDYKALFVVVLAITLGYQIFPTKLVNRISRTYDFIDTTIDNTAWAVTTSGEHGYYFLTNSSSWLSEKGQTSLSIAKEVGYWLSEKGQNSWSTTTEIGGWLSEKGQNSWLTIKDKINLSLS